MLLSFSGCFAFNPVLLKNNNHIAFFYAHDWNRFPLFGTTWKTCCSCTVRSVQSNIKIPLVLTVSESSALEERQRERKREQDGDDVAQTGIISSLRSFASALGYFSRPQAAAKRLAWGSDAMTSQRGGAKVDCCVIIFLGSPGKSLSGKIWSCFCLFFAPLEKQQVCVWADGQELADAPWGWNQLCRRPRSMFIFGLY